MIPSFQKCAILNRVPIVGRITMTRTQCIFSIFQIFANYEAYGWYCVALVTAVVLLRAIQF